ncbi:metal-sulfur cluster assembly factor [uncultured Bifidobacterium sp.]|uniref:metal-sulfur cluster assembly factor n=1 Tax=uncultured Bifidobacterium sp. TaxID=165187 RepID=UPI0028DC0330|nr:metal-sulfur cluster assembly factor [uncultured Bifidobacterium sp.]
MSDTLVPGPQSTIFDAVLSIVGDGDEANRVMTNPGLLVSDPAKKGNDFSATDSGTKASDDSLAAAGDVRDAGSGEESSAAASQTQEDGGGHHHHAGGPCACGRHDGSCCQDEDPDDEGGIPLKAVDDIGRATARDVREALHQVIDPELGIDVVDLGLVYGIEIDEKGRAIITMTLTTPACPLTDLLEDECASTLAGLVEEFRIDWTWQPQWTIDMITPEGREQLAAIGFNLDNMPRY